MSEHKHGDETVAEALRIAERRLIHLGWKFSCEDIGERAGGLLNALSKKLQEQKK